MSEAHTRVPIRALVTCVSKCLHWCRVQLDRTRRHLLRAGAQSFETAENADVARGNWADSVEARKLEVRRERCAHNVLRKRELRLREVDERVATCIQSHLDDKLGYRMRAQQAKASA